jgi:hypothetical protein
MNANATPVMVPLLAALVLLLTAFGGGSRAPLPALSAPYQIDGYEWPGGEGVAGSRLVVIGLGRAPDLGSPYAGVPVPASDQLEWMTLLGTRGWVHAARVKLERRCEYLCDYDGPEECRWVGLYAPQGPGEIGDIVGALPGRLDLAAFAALEPLPLEPRTPQDLDPIARLTAADTSAALLWDAYGSGMTLRVTEWGAARGRIVGFLGSDYADEQPIEADACRAAAYEWLLAIECNEFAVLASGGEPLLVSLADYNMSSAEPLARFDYGGSRHYVVRFGAKAQDVVGLVSGEPAGWRARFRPRDWAQLC